MELDSLSIIRNRKTEELVLELSVWSLSGSVGAFLLLVAPRVMRHACRLYFVIASCAVEHFSPLVLMNREVTQLNF